MQAALTDAGLSAPPRLRCIVAGISGYEGNVYGRQPDLPAQRVTLVHDTIIAHAGALDGAPGVVVIAGTGSVAYACDAQGNSSIAGGWGYLFGDEGSAFWLVRTALSDAMRSGERGTPAPLETSLLKHFSQPSLRALARAFYAGTISRGDLAAAAPLVLQDEHYVRLAAQELVELAALASGRIGMQSPSAAFAGGLMRSEALSRAIDRRLDAAPVRLRRVQPARDAAEGALVLAYRSV